MISYENTLKLLDFINENLDTSEKNSRYYSFLSLKIVVKRVIEDFNKDMSIENLYNMDIYKARELNKENEWFHILEMVLRMSYLVLPPTPANKRKCIFEEYRKSKNIEEDKQTPSLFLEMIRKYKLMSYEDILQSNNEEKKRKSKK